MRKGDIFILIIAVAVIVCSLLMNKDGKTATVYVDGKVYASLDTKADDSLVVDTRYGKNTVVVKGGKVYIADADCANKLCQKGSISKAGQSLVCLPHHLSVVIYGGESEVDVTL